MAIRCGCCGGEHATAAEVRVCCSGQAIRAETAPAVASGSAPVAAVAAVAAVAQSTPVAPTAPARAGRPEHHRPLAELAGPDVLGRNLVVGPGAVVPAPWAGATRLAIDAAALADPDPIIATLRPLVLARRRVVIELGVALDEPAEVELRAPHLLGPGFELPLAALHHLVWANSVDARLPDRPVWPLGERAVALGAEPGGPADVVLPDGAPAWCDGGPLLHPGGLDPRSAAVVHRTAIEHGSLRPLGPNQTDAALAPDQLAAVTHPAGAARIIAPAGSGKTRVLTERARLLLGRWQLPPSAICLVAFNKRAQEEMVARTPDVAGLRVRTLNSLGLAILNGDAPFAGGRPRVSTIDEPEVRRILGRLVKLPRRRNVDPLATWVEALGVARLGLRSPADVERRYGDDVPGFAAAHDAYRAELRRQHQVDFDEQILGAIELLLTDPLVRTTAQRACRLLLVDEFQDLTPAHLLLVRLLAAPGFEVFGVGDDDQTIYGYNGADPTWLIDYALFFPGAVDHPLEVNYRCPGDVVDGAAMLLRHNRRRVPKVIRAAKGGTDGVRLVETDEAPVATVTRVVELLDQGAEPGAIAVLARVNVVLAPVQVALAERGVPVRAAVGPELLDRTAVRATLAWLRLAQGQWSPDDLREVLRRPSRSLPPRVGEWVTEQNDVGGLRRLAGRLREERDTTSVDDLADDIEAVAALAARQPTPVVLRYVFDRVGLAPAVSKLDTTRHGMNATAQVDDLDALEWLARQHPDVTDFEAWLRSALTRRSAPGGVTLASVHKVKGQEWPHVVVHHVDAAQFPHRLADDIEEERRVFHVALTRAIETVTIVATPTPSPFIAELTTEPSAVAAEPVPPSPSRRSMTSASGAASKDPRVLVAVGLTLVDQGTEWQVVQVDDAGAVTTNGSATRRFDPGRSVQTAGGRRGPLTVPGSADPDGATIVATDALRRLRRELADGKPAYTVFDDKTIDAIVAAQPATMRDLDRVKGIGPAKLEAYGQRVLDMLAAAAPS